MKVLYFAWLRERLDRDFDDVTPPAEVKTIADLIDWLAARDEGLALAVENRSLIRTAREDELVPQDTPLAGASRIALFPPMTGG